MPRGQHRWSLGAAVEARDGARARLATTVAALRDLASFGDESGEIEIVETHMSFVFLTAAHAYKLKKPLRTASFDWSTVAARQHACQLELELNRRLARDVYLAVVPVVERAGALQVDAPGAAIDWLVKMRRLPRDRMLEARIAADAVADAEVDRLAAVLSAFYAGATPAAFDGPGYRAGIEADLAVKHASLAQPRYGLDRADVAAVASAQARWLARHRDLLEERAGCVVDAHGDLRPEHVCLLDPRPVVIDCLEFDRELRRLDPIAELSFLALECRRLGAAWIGERVLDRHAEASGARVSRDLVAFYQSHHAVIRAAIAVWHLDDDALDHSSRWRQRGSWYLRDARRLQS